MRTRIVLFVLAATAVTSVFSQQPASVVYQGSQSVAANFSPEGEKLSLNFQRRPSFAGGPIAIRQFLADHLTYPDIARNHNFEGTVTLRLTISAEGEVKKIEVRESAGELLDQEAVRVASLMPRFIPARQGRANVASYYYLPIKFSLE